MGYLQAFFYQHPWNTPTDAIVRFWLIAEELETIVYFRLFAGGLHKKSDLSGQYGGCMRFPVLPAIASPLRRPHDVSCLNRKPLTPEQAPAAAQHAPAAARSFRYCLRLQLLCGGPM